MTATARALYLPLMARAARQPVILLVADNKAAEALEPMLKAGCELTGAVDPAQVVRFPAHDVLPFENLSPHPDVQEQRAAALWKLATGAVDILIAPVESAALKLFDREYYAGLAVQLRRSEEVDVEVLTGPWPRWATRRWTWWRCRGSSRGGAGFWMCTRRNRTGLSALSSSVMRLRRFANSTRRRSGRNRASTRRSCCR